MLSSVCRAAVRGLALRPIVLSRQVGAASPLVARDKSVSRWANSGLARSFATRLVLRKQAAGATATTQKASKTTKKPVTKKKPATKKPATKKKPAAKAKKPAAKAKKPVKKRARKELTPEQKDKQAIRALKVKALLRDTRFKRLPQTSWTLYLANNALKSEVTRENFGSHTSELARSFKFLSSSEISRLQEEARLNKLKNEAAMRTFIEGHTPDAIRVANNARTQLRSKYNLTKAKPLKDERQPPKPSNAFSHFTKARWASGDLADQKTLVDAAKAVSAEWKAMSDAEKEPYLELSKADSKRYEKDVARMEKEWTKVDSQ